jgi:hypothetical protein
MSRRPPTCAWRGCVTRIKLRRSRQDSQRQLTANAEAFASERSLLNDQPHKIVCGSHHMEITRRLQELQLSRVVPDTAIPPPPAPAAFASASSMQPAPVGQTMAALIFAAHLQGSVAPIPAVALRSVSLPIHLHSAPAYSAIPAVTLCSTSLPIQLRPLAFDDLHTPTHPYARVVQPRHEPRLSRSLTDELYEQRMEGRRSQRQWTSKRAEREASSYERGWDRMLERGGNEYTNWPLSGMRSILEKTTCCSWDGEDGVEAEKPREGCQRFMQLVGMQRVVHDHIRIRLQCRGEACGRQVTVSNHPNRTVVYQDIPADIRQHSYSPYILTLSHGGW